ncbi:MAG: anthranilate phosphoribosyltransferase [Actinobacteria bacterium]|nr:anthranilate phosphoribosyltransferase [Actinomycetota bacterium]
MIKEAIKSLSSGIDLSRDEAARVVKGLLGGDASDAAVAGLLVALKMKGETIEEIAGFAGGLREMAVTIEPDAEFMVDTCGTGGDGKHTFNISTASALITAGAGAAVAKHGNRAASSVCGSADVLEALGINITMTPENAVKCLEETGIAFLFAPLYHPAMKNVMGARKELGIPTIFNLVGPLANPAGADCQVMGVNRKELVETMGEVLGRLGASRAYVLHGFDGMDEFTLTGETLVCELIAGGTRSYTMSPADLGLKDCGLEDLLGGDPETNASIIEEVLSNKPGPMLDISLANAAFALSAAGIAAGPVEGVQIAREAVESGAAARKLESLRELSKAMVG